MQATGTPDQNHSLAYLLALLSPIYRDGRMPRDLVIMLNIVPNGLQTCQVMLIITVVLWNNMRFGSGEGRWLDFSTVFPLLDNHQAAVMEHIHRLKSFNPTTA